MFRRYKVIAIKYGFLGNYEVVGRYWSRSKAESVAEQVRRFGYTDWLNVTHAYHIREVRVYDPRGFVIYSYRRDEE